MKLEQSHIDQMTTAFKMMQSKEDLLQLLNEAKPLVYGDKAKAFELKQLTWYANATLGGKRYAEFKIRKKSGSERSIHAPVKGLKSLQKTLSFVLQCVYEPHHAAMGFVKDKSIVDNAKLHVGSKYVYNIDLKDFFPSIDKSRVWKCLQLKPFSLTDQGNDKTEEDTKLNTGIRKFVTDYREHIFYKLSDGSITLIIDKKKNFERYRKRITSHIPAPDTKGMSLIEKIGGSLITEYKKQVNEALFRDVKRYVLTPQNINKTKRIAASRINLADIIASLCCTEMEVERQNKAGEWEKVKRNV